MEQSYTVIRPRNSRSSPHQHSSSSYCSSSKTKKNHRFTPAVVDAVTEKKNYQAKRKSSPAAMPRSRRSAPRVRFSHPVQAVIRIPRIDDKETQSRLYYSAMEVARFRANERVRRQVLILTVILYKDQINRHVHRRELMPAYLVVAVFHKMLSKFRRIAASAITTIGGASSKATTTRKIGRPTTIEVPKLDDSAKRPTKRCRVDAETTRTIRQWTPPGAQRRVVSAQCA
jgi:hypothetical protein